MTRTRISCAFPPAYSPDANAIERTWWHLHGAITQNHQFQTMEELLDLVFDCLEHCVAFEVERDIYTKKRAAWCAFPIVWSYLVSSW